MSVANQSMLGQKNLPYCSKGCGANLGGKFEILIFNDKSHAVASQFWVGYSKHRSRKPAEGGIPKIFSNGFARGRYYE